MIIPGRRGLEEVLPHIEEQLQQIVVRNRHQSGQQPNDQTHEIESGIYQFQLYYPINLHLPLNRERRPLV